MATAELMLNRAHYPVLTLGPGVRAGIWVQGCTIGCHGCASQDTWDADPSRLIEVGRLTDWIASLPQLQGLTVTGGEPFQQPVAVAALLSEIRAQSASQGRTLDVLVYSGYTYAALARRAAAAAVLDLCDAVVTGPYIDRLNPGGAWRGSANQKLIVLTQLGRERFAAAADVAEKRLQVSSDGRRFWLIGIPGRGDLGRLERGLASRGLTLEGESWPD